MLEKIIEFFNNNPVVTVIVICVMIFLIWSYTNKYYAKNMEKLASVPSVSPSGNILPPMPSSTFQSLYSTPDGSKMINFKCTINGIDYYLANMDTTQNTSSLQTDCQVSTLVLIPASDIEKDLHTYLNLLDSNSKVCNYDACIKQLPPNASSEECPGSKQHGSCNYDRFYTHDFKVQFIGVADDGSNKYLFKGVTNPVVNSICGPGIPASQPTLLNQSMFDSPGGYGQGIKPNPLIHPLPVVCSDYFPYGNVMKYNNRFGEVYVSETEVNTGGIIGLTSGISVKLAFSTQVLLNGTDPNTKNPTFIPCPGCKPNTIYTYLGVCPSANNGKGYTFTTQNGKTYQRICYIPANAATTAGDNILNFQPILVQ